MLNSTSKTAFSKWLFSNMSFYDDVHKQYVFSLTCIKISFFITKQAILIPEKFVSS